MIVKSFFWYINWKFLFTFITEYIDVNIILFFKFVTIINFNMKLNMYLYNPMYGPILCLIFLIRLESLSCGLRCLIWHQRKHSLSSFIKLINPLSGLRNSGGSGIYAAPFKRLILHNSQIMTINFINCPTKSIW